MRKLLAIMFVAILAGCATPPPPPPPQADQRFAGVSTAQLQQRRLELYGLVPRYSKRRDSTHYTTQYITHGQPLPQQDEIVLIERELNRRRSAGDKAAYFERSAPAVTPISPQG